MNIEPTTSFCDRKDLQRCWLDQGKIDVLDHGAKAHLLPRWKTSVVTESDIEWPLPRKSLLYSEQELTAQPVYSIVCIAGCITEECKARKPKCQPRRQLWLIYD